MDTGTAPPAQVWPMLRAHDALALIDFLVDVVGFRRNTVMMGGDSDTRVGYAQLDWPDGGGIMLGSHRPDAAWSRPPGSSATYVVADDVDSVYDRAIRAGSLIIEKLTDTDYGNHEFALQDPEGNLWVIGTHHGAPPADAPSTV